MTDAILQAAREHWNLHNASIELVAARENRVYRVQTKHQTTALRLHRIGYRTEEEIHSELQWMDMLARRGIPVPRPVNSVEGTPLKVIDGTMVDMLSWVEGTPLSKEKVTESHYYRLGRLCAQMHQLADQWSAGPALTRPTWDFIGEQPTWGRFWENPLLTKAQQVLFNQFRHAAQKALAALQQPDTGLIHADLVPDNVLVNGEQLHPIDFDDGGFGYRLFDVATITFRSRREEGGDSLASATIAGYCSERSLDLNSLPLFEALRACTYVGWNISRMGEAGGVARNRRFIEAAERAIGAASLQSI